MHTNIRESRDAYCNERALSTCARRQTHTGLWERPKPIMIKRVATVVGATLVAGDSQRITGVV
jgi:hypothetical protein